jgi:hypothetical protein
MGNIIYIGATKLIIDYHRSVCDKKRQSMYVELEELEYKRRVLQIVSNLDE